jgi:hypothetical protein
MVRAELGFINVSPGRNGSLERIKRFLTFLTASENELIINLGYALAKRL